MKPAYETTLGRAYCADAIDVLREIESESVHLVVTSPPYALHFKKEYGNVSQQEYVKWLSPYCREIRRILRSDGSFVLNIGGAWTAGEPTRSLYHVRMLLHLCDDLDFKLCQDMFWFNPAKMPAPAEWVNVRRIRVKDSVEYIYWLGKTAMPKADNGQVLQAYSPDMQRLIRRGVKATTRPSGHAIRETFAKDRGGAIPPNFLQCGNNESNSRYIKRMKAMGRKIHPARFPAELPRFFIQFLTKAGDLVVDPFAGSNTTGAVAQALGRRWIATELRDDYVEDSRVRFEVGADAADGPVPGSRQLNLIR